METIIDIVKQHLRRYPEMEMSDLYKLVYQAFMGSEHALLDIDAARRWLDQEIEDLEDGPDEPLPDPISPDRKIVRIHLRPYLKSGGQAGKLMDAFVATAQTLKGELFRLDQAWCEIEKWAGLHPIPFPEAEFRSFNRMLREKKYPVLHHSRKFTSLYYPAYRVVHLQFTDFFVDI